MKPDHIARMIEEMARGQYRRGLHMYGSDLALREWLGLAETLRELVAMSPPNSAEDSPA